MRPKWNIPLLLFWHLLVKAIVLALALAIWLATIGALAALHGEISSSPSPTTKSAPQSCSASRITDKNGQAWWFVTVPGEKLQRYEDEDYKKALSVCPKWFDKLYKEKKKRHEVATGLSSRHR